jgi:hypothetical protein
MKRADLDGGLSAQEAFFNSSNRYRQSLQFTENIPPFLLNFQKNGWNIFVILDMPTELTAVQKNFVAASLGVP